MKMMMVMMMAMSGRVADLRMDVVTLERRTREEKSVVVIKRHVCSAPLGGRATSEQSENLNGGRKRGRRRCSAF